MLPHPSSPPNLPLRPQRARPGRVPLLQNLRRNHLIRPKRAEILAQFAPGEEQPAGLAVADQERPNRARRLAAGFVLAGFSWGLVNRPYSRY